MEEYYKNEFVSLYCCDSYQFLKQYKDKVDAIITDPPYAINYQHNQWDKKKFDITIYYPLFKNCLKQDGNLLMFQGWSSVVNSISNLDLYQLKLKNWIIWDRIKGRGAKTNFVSTREDILWITNGQNYTFNNQPSTIKKKTGGSIGTKNGCEFRKLTNVWTDISPIVPWSKQRINHPTQKPIKLIERLIRIFSNEYETILDPFAGSGTTGQACYLSKRKCILIQKQRDYCDLIINRLNKL